MLKKSTINQIITTSFLTITLCYSAYSQGSHPSSEDNEDMLFDLSLEDLLSIEVVTGTRSKSRKRADATVAIDSYDAESLKLHGSGDLTMLLRDLIPSYNALPKTSDGNAFVHGATLRGLPPDDVLLLVNSKRRHRAALIQHAGPAVTAGAHAADPAPIPAIALKNIELLRDGAASQYGSDAIAGVLNFILKDNNEGGHIEAQWGEFYDGERTITIAGNIGLSLGERGFVNLSAEYMDYEQLIRGFQPAAAQAAIDAGNTQVGLDSPYAGDNLAQTWGRPETDGLRTAWNMGYQLGDDQQLYGFGNYADYFGDYRFFYRALNHPSLQPMPLDPNDPSQGNFCWCDTLSGGYTPHLQSDITDLGATLGLRGERTDGISYDFSVSFGRNEIDYQLKNTLNPSFGPDSPRDFGVGDLTQKELNISADFSKPMSDTLNFAWGVEWREETYVMVESQLEAWSLGPWAGVGTLINPLTNDFYAPPPLGSNGLSGTTADAAGSFSRDNYAIYADIEWLMSEAALIQSALRVEEFSDFGSTVNGKLAARYKLTDNTTLRGAISTGFRAPTPGQSNYTGIRTTADTASGILLQDGTISPTSDLALSLGGKALDAEKSTNLSVGLTSALRHNLSLAIDLYWIELKDRIAKTIDIVAEDRFFTRASFYTNALTSETQGFDLSLQYLNNWQNGSTTQLSFSYNYNESKITGQNQVNGINPVSDLQIFNIEHSLPQNRFNLTATHQFNYHWQLKLKANFFGETHDERVTHEKRSARTLADIEVTYQSSQHWSLTLGASNLFDTYPSKIDGQLSDGLSYGRRSPVGYDGGMMYMKLGFSW